ncbi:MAG TPA: hypothetical protein VNR39_19720 [Pseudolabrys sp.]|nr:hypothetical protein [Pseudolabrys sp.]
MKDASMISLSLSADCAVRRAQLYLLTSAYAQWLTKYRPDQARVPAGSREGGQWTNEGGSGDFGDRTGAAQDGRPSNTGRVDVSTEKIDVDRYSASPFDIEFVGSRTGVTIDYSRALTGVSTIDDTTKKLSETLGDTMSRVDFIPEWTPTLYGTAVHANFAAQVRSQGLRGVEVEQSFRGGELGGDRSPGSVRTDVLLRNDGGDIIAIYDVKTGGAVLTPARVRELRAKTGVGIGVPIIELQANRGATIKGGRVRMRSVGCVMASLWNPVHRDNVRRAAGA